MDNPRPLLTQKVSDFYPLALVLDCGIDGEVGIHQSHLVLKAASHSLDKVLHSSMDAAQQLPPALKEH